MVFIEIIDNDIRLIYHIYKVYIFILKGVL